jgi:hypothetical protein
MHLIGDTFQLHLDLGIDFKPLLGGGISEMDGNRVAKELGHLLEAATLSLGKEEIHNKNADKSEAGKDDVIAPGYVGDGGGSRGHVGDAGNEIGGGREGYAA